MSLFGTLMGKIFNHGIPSLTGTTSVQGNSAPTVALQAPASQTPSAPVDVSAVLTKLSEQSKEKLDWKHSIVDLMKLVGMDSSHSNRVALANELHFTGDVQDSAAMNIWLHKAVMTKLAENGGTIPKELM